MEIDDSFLKLLTLFAAEFVMAMKTGVYFFFFFPLSFPDGPFFCPPPLDWNLALPPVPQFLSFSTSPEVPLHFAPTFHVHHPYHCLVTLFPKVFFNCYHPVWFPLPPKSAVFGSFPPLKNPFCLVFLLLHV